MATKIYTEQQLKKMATKQLEALYTKVTGNQPNSSRIGMIGALIWAYEHNDADEADLVVETVPNEVDELGLTPAERGEYEAAQEAANLELADAAHEAYMDEHFAIDDEAVHKAATLDADERAMVDAALEDLYQPEELAKMVHPETSGATVEHEAALAEFAAKVTAGGYRQTVKATGKTPRQHIIDEVVAKRFISEGTSDEAIAAYVLHIFEGESVVNVTCYGWFCGMMLRKVQFNRMINSIRKAALA